MGVYSVAPVGGGHDRSAHLTRLSTKNIPKNGSSRSSNRSGAVMPAPYNGCLEIRKHQFIDLLF